MKSKNALSTTCNLNFRRFTVDDDFDINKLKTKYEDNINISNAFIKFVKNTITKMESEVELNILRNLYQKIENPIVKTELLLAYKKRKDSINTEIAKITEVTDIESNEEKIDDDVQNVTYDNINDFNNKLIGYFCDFGLKDIQKYYKVFIFGDYFKDTLKYSTKFALMGTTEAFKIINIIKRWENKSNPNWSLLNNVTKYKELMEEYNEDLNLFINLYYELSESFGISLNKLRFNKFYDDLFANSFLFDDILMITINYLFKKELRTFLSNKNNQILYFDKYLKAIIDNTDSQYFHSSDLDSIHLFMKHDGLTLGDYEFKFKFSKENLIKLRKLPDILEKFSLKNFRGLSSNLLIHGYKGSGKSCLLAFVTMWAYKNNYIVFKIPSAYAITHDQRELVRHEKSRLYLQPELGVNILRDLLSSSKSELEAFKVNKDIYGYYNSAGVHSKQEYPAVENTYYKNTDSYFYDTDKMITPQEREHYEGIQRKYNSDIKSLLPNPNNLKEIAEKGIECPEYSINAIAEILEQMYNTDNYKVLISIDDYNFLYRKTIYPSFRYDNLASKRVRGYVHPEHLALVRLIIKFDGHRIKNGFKMCASSTRTYTKHEFSPEKINFPDGADIELQGIDYDDFRNYVYYCYNNKLYHDNIPSESMIKYMFSECQGNFGEALFAFKHPDLRSFK